MSFFFILAEIATSSTFFTSSTISSALSQDSSTASLESTQSLETAATSSLSSSSWDWDWDDETASTSSVTASTSTYSERWDETSSTSSVEWDWNLSPTSSTSVASYSIPSIEELFVFMYEALERDHLGLRRREVEEPILQERSDLTSRDDKQSQMMKRKALGLKSKDFVKEMLQRAVKKRSSKETDPKQR